MQNIARAIALIIVTAIIWFLLTSIFVIVSRAQHNALPSDVHDFSQPLQSTIDVHQLQPANSNPQEQ